MAAFQMPRHSRWFLLFLALPLVRGCEPPDCDRPDCGTCGNACCNMQYVFDTVSPVDLYSRLSQSLSAGGPDQHYQFIGGADFRPHHFATQFMLQGQHTTLVNRYNDTLYFNIYNAPDASFGTIVQCFSISQITGALCDQGQNYKNIAALIKAMGIPFYQNTLRGCATLPMP